MAHLFKKIKKSFLKLPQKYYFILIFSLLVFILSVWSTYTVDSSIPLKTFIKLSVQDIPFKGGV